MVPFTKTIVSLEPINVDYTTPSQSKKESAGYSVGCVFAGDTVTGTVSLEHSTDGSNWDAVEGTAIVLAAAGTVDYNLSDQNYPRFRVKWVDDSSSSNATVTITSHIMAR